MAQKVVNESVIGVEGETLTTPGSGGTRSSYNIRRGYEEILVEPVAALRLQLVPKIAALLYYDASAAVANRWINILENWPLFLDRVATEAFTTPGAWTTLDRLYVGTTGFIGGYTVDMGATVNAVVNTLTAEYSPAEGDFAAMTVATDGTAAGGATLAVDGLVTFTVPADWAPRKLNTLVPSLTPPNLGPLYWHRLAVSVNTTADIVINNLTNIGRIAPGTDSTTARTGGVWLKATTEYTLDVSPEVGAIETIAQAAGATTVRVSWIRR